MKIRGATEEDLPGIRELGRDFGHLMLYQKDKMTMEKYLPRIIVAEERKEVVGYYHYIVSGDPGFAEMLRCYRQFPEELVQEAVDFGPHGLCICMQGASHREVFQEFIKWLQERFEEVWCYCSVKSRRPETYEHLGFTFSPHEEYTFWNVNKGDYSTYRLGRWKR